MQIDLYLIGIILSQTALIVSVIHNAVNYNIFFKIVGAREQLGISLKYIMLVKSAEGDSTPISN